MNWSGSSPIPELFIADSLEKLCHVANALGRLHGTAGLRPILLSKLFPALTIKEIINGRENLFGAQDTEAIRQLLFLLKDALGDNYVPFSLGDLKSEHVRGSWTTCRFIDLETLRVGVPEQFDVLALINLAPSFKLAPDDWDMVISVYLQGRAHSEAYIPFDTMRESLRLAAKGFGIVLKLNS